MGEEEQQYEVESVIGARVEKKRGRKLIWKYHVKWKGYGLDENTWEPEDSFDSTDFILRFWERARTDGRDYRDLSVFRVGEQFVPMGPPRKLKTAQGETNTSTPEQDASELRHSVNESSSKQLGKRPQSSIADIVDEQPPAKRTRGQALVASSSNKPTRVQQPPLLSPSVPLPKRPSAVNKSPSSPNPKSLFFSPARAQQQRKKPPRPVSPEFVPDSDEEQQEIAFQNYDKQEHKVQVTQQNQNVMDVQSSSSNSHQTRRRLPDIEDIKQLNVPPQSPPETFDPLFDEVAPTNIPFHQAAKSLVKAVDDPGYVNSGQGISVKARLGVASTSDGPRRSKAGPGRSSAGLMLQKNKPSLLTASKGGLKTIKGKYMKPAENLTLGEESRMDVDSSHVAMPLESVTAGQLFQLAGFNERDAVDLPDFEDTIEDPPTTQLVTEHTLQSTTSTEAVEKQAVPTLVDSLALAKDKLFPSGLATMVSDTVSAAWRRPTIFGPLGLGTNPFGGSISAETSKSTRSSPFMLPLDNSVTVPVLLTDVLSTNGPSLDFIVGSTGPPGKFYGPDAALTLLNTIRAGGPSARIVIGDSCSNEDEKHFERFCARLHSGDLFVGMAGVDLLAFCSSRALVAQRLNLPEQLLILSDGIVVSRVVVEDYSAYADAVEKADETRWLQYISQ